MEKTVAVIINGNFSRYVNTIEEAEEILNPEKNRISRQSPDGARTYFYDNQADADADKDGAYVDQYYID